MYWDPHLSPLSYFYLPSFFPLLMGDEYDGDGDSLIPQNPYVSYTTMNKTWPPVPPGYTYLGTYLLFTSWLELSTSIPRHLTLSR